MAEHVLIHTEASAGIITLNRPAAMNALNLGMVRIIAGALEAWRAATDIDRVLIESAAPNAFCAGGDLREIRSHSIAGRIDSAVQLFREEYALNLMIARYPKPYVALIDGICMGGGIGVSVHGPFRIVTERASLAMPEVAIGMFPDVGMTYTLPRLPSSIGRWIALTGSRLQATEAVEAKLATHFVTSASLPHLRADLIFEDEVNLAIAKHCKPVGTTSVGYNRARAEECFGHPSMAQVVASLKKDGSVWAADSLSALRRASPHSLLVTMDLLNRGRREDLESCLTRELATARAIIQHHDFIEGVRAILIDKDRNPHWAKSPAL